MSKLKKNIIYILAFITPLLLTVVLLYFMNRIAGADAIFKNVGRINSSVINQAIFIFALEVYGLIIMMCFNRYLSKLKIVMLSFIVGTLLWCLASVVVVCVGIAFTWYWTVIVCLIFAIALYFMLKLKMPNRQEIIFYTKSLGLYISIAFFFAALCVFRFSYDSYMYVNTGMKIAKLGFLSEGLIEIVSGFSLFTPMLYSPAVFFGYDFSQGVNLLLNTQFTVFIGYAVYSNLKERTSLKISVMSGALAVLALISSNIYLELMYWPMSNMLTAMTLFGIIYFSHKAIIDNSKANMILSAIFGMCFVLIRSENMLLYICIMFLVSLSNVNKKHLSLHILSAALALALWYFKFFAVAGLNFSEGAFLTVARAVQLMSLFIAFIVYVMFFSKTKFALRKRKMLEGTFFIAMIGAIVLLGILKPDFFAINMEATIVNVFYDGSWAGALITLSALYLMKLYFEKKIDYYDKSIFIFILFYIIIFLLRAMPLRIGFGDSGSRYFAHILPIVVYAISTSLAVKASAERIKEKG